MHELEELGYVNSARLVSADTGPSRVQVSVSKVSTGNAGLSVAMVSGLDLPVACNSPSQLGCRVKH